MVYPRSIALMSLASGRKEPTRVCWKTHRFNTCFYFASDSATIFNSQSVIHDVIHLGPSASENLHDSVAQPWTLDIVTSLTPFCLPGLTLIIASSRGPSPRLTRGPSRCTPHPPPAWYYSCLFAAHTSCTPFISSSLHCSEHTEIQKVFIQRMIDCMNEGFKFHQFLERSHVKTVKRWKS